jgi:hypothetical protein
LSVKGVLAYLQPQPEPTPSFRGQEEEPVADSSGGGIEAVSAADPQPPVLDAPLVVAPAMPIAARVVPSAESSSVAPTLGNAVPRVTAPDIAVGPTARAVPTSEPLSSNSVTPMGSQVARQGYPRFLRTATVGQLAAAALPGVAGLMLITASGSLIGYRQANSGRMIRLDPNGAARFLR